MEGKWTGDREKEAEEERGGEETAENQPKRKGQEANRERAGEGQRYLKERRECEGGPAREQSEEGDREEKLTENDKNLRGDEGKKKAGIGQKKAIKKKNKGKGRRKQKDDRSDGAGEKEET